MIKTRSETTGIEEHLTFQCALEVARKDDSIWKISFQIEDGTKVRLIKTIEGWTYENIVTGNRDD